MLQDNIYFRANNANEPNSLLLVVWFMHLSLSVTITCGEDDILGDELMIHNGELGQFNLVHPRHSIVSSSPVELNVICSVTIWEGTENRNYWGLLMACMYVHNRVPSGSRTGQLINHSALD